MNYDNNEDKNFEKTKTIQLMIIMKRISCIVLFCRCSIVFVIIINDNDDHFVFQQNETIVR